MPQITNESDPEEDSDGINKAYREYESLPEPEDEPKPNGEDLWAGYKKACEEGTDIARLKEADSGEWKETPNIALLSDLTPEEISWFLPGYLGVGLITLVQGPVGARKTTLMLGWAAAMTQGGGYHLDVKHEKRGVLYVTMESGINYKQLLRHAGGNLSMFMCFGSVAVSRGEEQYDKPLNLWGDKVLLREACTHVPDLGCIIVDPIGSHIGDKNRSDNVHKCYSVLEQLMEEFKCCCVVTSHLNKDPFKGSDARASGATELVSRSRCFFTAAKDKEDRSLSHLIPVRTSFYDEQKLGFSFRNSENNVGATWATDKYGGTADDALRQDEGGEGSIRLWINSMLPLGDTVLVSKIKNECDSAGFDWKSVQRTKCRMSSIKSVKINLDIKGKIADYWHWIKT